MSTNGSSQGSHGSKSISTIESELEIMTKRLDSTSKEKILYIFYFFKSHNLVWKLFRI